MVYQAQLTRWQERALDDPDLIAELDTIKDDPAAVSDRFYRDLSFGTGGLRGVIGAGPNRMNLYTVRRGVTRIDAQGEKLGGHYACFLQ